MATNQDQYPAYAVKSDDSKNQQNQYPAYAVKSDDGKNRPGDPIILNAYAVKSDDGERPEH